MPYDWFGGRIRGTDESRTVRDVTRVVVSATICIQRWWPHYKYEWLHTDSRSHTQFSKWHQTRNAQAPTKDPIIHPRLLPLRFFPFPPFSLFTGNVDEPFRPSRTHHKVVLFVKNATKTHLSWDLDAPFPFCPFNERQHVVSFSSFLGSFRITWLHDKYCWDPKRQPVLVYVKPTV